MSSLSEISPQTQNDSRTETPNRFQRKLLTNKVPRRYIMALFLFFLHLIHHWMLVNDLYTLAASFSLYEEEYASEDGLSGSANWTVHELDSYLKSSMATDIIVQMPGALLIFIFSSHKYLLVSIVLTSILHMLTPTAIRHHSAVLIVVLFLKYAIASPSEIAVLSVWKDWAPQQERTKLIIFSFAGTFLTVSFSDYYLQLIAYNLKEEHFYYAGLSGLIWAAFWHNLTFDTPQTDPLISERELLYMENTIPAEVQQKIKIAYVPWKSIITSKQVLIQCLIHVKSSCSISIIIMSSQFLLVEEYPELINLEICFILIFVIIIPCSAIVADVLIKKFSGRTLQIRKCFLCGGFILQSVFILGSFSTSHFVKVLCYFIAYTFYAASLPGFLTIPLDLSARYVTIISGIIFTFYFTGDLVFDFVMDSMSELNGPHTFSWILLIDAVISVVCAALFGFWGEVNEQMWSFNLSARSRPEGYKSYPKPDDEDDVNLVSELGDGEIFKI